MYILSIDTQSDSKYTAKMRLIRIEEQKEEKGVCGI
jgi:hypothetical protein